MKAPPALPSAPCRSEGLSAAFFANLVLPGMGQWMRGRRVRGTIYAVLFCFFVFALLGSFVSSYAHYLRTVMSGNLFRDQVLEDLGRSFSWKRLLGLFLAALAVLILAQIDLFVSARRRPSLIEVDKDRPSSPQP